MKSKRNARLLGASALAVIFFMAVNVVGGPRPPLPPIPERDLFNLRFDGTYWLGYPRTQPLATLNTALADSWSGQALDMSGPDQKILAFAIQDGAGKPRLNQSVGSLRFWFTQTTWSGPDGTPGHPAILFELGTWTPSGPPLSSWTLAITADGTAIQLLAHTGGGPTEILRAPLLAHWLPGQWHQIGLVYDAGSGSALFLDGVLAAQGPPVALTPLEPAPGTLGFAIGASVQGDLPAEGLFDEFYVFPFVQSSDNFAWNWQTLAPIAALGPVTDAELAARRSLAQARGLQTMDSQQGPPPPQGGGSGGGGTNCTCNTPTNFTVGRLYSSNGLALGIAQTTNPWIALTIQTLTTNQSYDVLGTASLADLGPPSLSRTNWTWLMRANGRATNFSWGETNWCERYLQLGTVQDSDNDGLTDAYEQLVSHTATNVANSPGAIYETVIASQSPSDWFKLNDSSLTNAISGQAALTSTGTWDVDAFATGSNAINFNGSSQRLTAGDVISSGTGTNRGSMSLLFRSLTGHANTNISIPRYVFSQKGNATNEFALFFETTNTTASPGSLKVRIGSQTNSILASNDIVFGTWYYLAMTWNEATNRATWYLAPIGGTLSSSNVSFGATNVVGNSSNVVFGNRQNDGGNYTNAFRTPGNGAVHQIALWNRELTAPEVNAQFNTLNALFQGPAKVFDLTRWNILLPVDNTNGLNTNNLALEIRTGWLNSGFKYVDPADWTQKYFYLSTTNTMVFEAPWNGARSSGGSGARSELRETLADGNEDNWTPLRTNILEATCAVINAGTNGTNKVIIGQIYCDSTGKPTFAVNYNHPHLKEVSVTYKFLPDGSTGDDDLILATNVNLLDLIHYKVQLLDDGTTVKIRGEVFGPKTTGQQEHTQTPYPQWHTNTFYFKAGCYYPNNPTSGTAKVTFFSLSATRE